MSRRTDLFDAVRPFAPAGKFTESDVAAIDGLADRWSLPRAGVVAVPGVKPTPPAVVDLVAFFAGVRATFGPLTQGQVDGFNAVLKALAGWPVSWQAYALATAWHETAKTMQPIKERGGEAYFKRMYDIEGARPAKARELGNLTPGDGAKFPGMGFVQSTGRANARRATVELRKRGILGPADDLEATPHLLMRPDIAAAVLRLGMEEGWFTGKKLVDYLPRDRQGGDYVNARRIINGTDKAAEIAAHAVKFEKALRS